MLFLQTALALIAISGTAATPAPRNSPLIIKGYGDLRVQLATHEFAAFDTVNGTWSLSQDGVVFAVAEPAYSKKIDAVFASGGCLIETADDYPAGVGAKRDVTGPRCTLLCPSG